MLCAKFESHNSLIAAFDSLSDSNDRSGGELSTIGVAAAIAGPMCVICALIMVFICWHQKRQLKKQEQFHEAEAALQPLEEEAVIPSGQTLKELMDMSTGSAKQPCNSKHSNVCVKKTVTLNSALQAATILVAMASEKKNWQLHFPNRSPNWQLGLAGH